MNKALSVSQLNHYLKNLIEDDLILNDILLEAEVSNFKYHSNGNMYFTLKDECAAINCVIFKSFAATINFNIKDGMYLLVYGKVNFYERSGQFQLCIDYVQPLGKGYLFDTFEKLKEKLFNEGLFDQAHKKNIPSFPNCIGVITSDTGAAIHDIIKVIRKQNNFVRIVLIPTLVQGNDAPFEIAKAIKKANDYGKMDVIILGRGGGSIEDLWAFNEEIVVRSVYNSKIPIVSAVGHETDYTLTDFAADLRAPTPSAAAQLVAPDLNQINNNLLSAQSFLHKKILDMIDAQTEILADMKNELDQTMKYKLEKIDIELKNKLTSLENLSPVSILKRGYSFVYDDDNPKLSFADLKIGSHVKIKFASGCASAKIISKSE